MDPTKVEFLKLCRMVLKGEESPSSLQPAISAVRVNLNSLRQDFLRHFSSLSEAIQEKCSEEMKEVTSALSAYLVGVNVVEKHFSNKEQATLVRGTELVGRAFERLSLSLYRYQMAVLALEGPTGIPSYNLFVRLLKNYKEKKIIEKDVQTFLQVARYSVDQAIAATVPFKILPEVAQLLDAFQKHQESLTAFEQCLAANQPFDEHVETFRERCEAIRSLQGPAQLKIFGQGPTPSECANRMINISIQILNRRVPMDFFNQSLVQLEEEFALFKRQIEILQASSHSTDSSLLKDACVESQAGMERFEKALEEFHCFQERKDSRVLIGAIKILREAVSRLYHAWRMIAQSAEQEGKVLCLRCEQYNFHGRKHCEKCGAILPQLAEDPEAMVDREVRDALLNMPATENIKNLLEAGQGVCQGRLGLAEFQQEVGRMEERIDTNVRVIELARKKEVGKRKKAGFTGVEETAYGLFNTGVRELKQGLYRYKQFAENADANLIQEGSKQIILGAYKIYNMGKCAAQASA